MAAKEGPGGAAGGTRYLNYDDLVETVGASTPLDQLRDLEILFLTFDEVSGTNAPSIFMHTPKLERLALLDNGLKHISGLVHISRTLTNLTICDQPITNIDADSLHLPNLRTLYLHRNEITSLEGLSGCPRVTKLWVFQNKIRNLSGLHALPELQTLWIQANLISSLRGIEMASHVEELALSGNPISDFAELNKLKKLPRLKSLSMNDVHFGRCPISEEPTYKEYILSALKSVRTLDDIVVTKDKTATAENTLQAQAKQFSDALKAIDSDFQSSMQEIDSSYNTRETHCVALEKEMSVALQELQVLVKDSRSAIASHVTRHEDLMATNMSALEMSLNAVLGKHSHDLLDCSRRMQGEYDLVSSLYLILERILIAEEAITACMCDAYTYGIGVAEVDRAPPSADPAPAPAQANATKAKSSSKTAGLKQKDANSAEAVCADFAFQTLPSSSPDFHLFAGQVQSTATLARPWSASSASGMPSSAESAHANLSSRVVVWPLELVRLYRLSNNHPSSHSSHANVAHAPSDGTSSTATNLQRQHLLGSSPLQGSAAGGSGDMVQVFTILTVSELSLVLRKGWGALGKSRKSASSSSSASASACATSVVFCTHADVLAAIYSGAGAGVNGTGSSFAFAFNEADFYGEVGKGSGDVGQAEAQPAAAPAFLEVGGLCEEGSLEDSYANDAFETSHASVGDVGADEGSVLDVVESKQGKKAISPQRAAAAARAGEAGKKAVAAATSNTTQKNTKTHKAAGNGNANISAAAVPSLEKLRTAAQKHVYIVVSTHVSRQRMNAQGSGSSSSGGGSQHTPQRDNLGGGGGTMDFPADRRACEAAMASLTGATGGTGADVGCRRTLMGGRSIVRGGASDASPAQQSPKAGGESGSLVAFYSLPYQSCSDFVPNVSLEYASICISPPADGAGVRSIEGRLELLLLPTQQVDRSGTQLAAFHSEVSSLVQQHIAQLMEGLSQQHAAALRSAESEIKSREKHLKSLREDVEQERRQQDAALKDLRALSLSAHGDAESSDRPAGGGGGGGGGLSKSGSSKAPVRSAKR